MFNPLHLFLVLLQGNQEDYLYNTRPATVLGLDGYEVTPISAISDQHQCILLSTGFMKCVGDGDYGQLGNGDYEDHENWVDVVDMFDVDK